MNRLLSISEAAKLLGISRVAVLKQIQKGTLRAEKVGKSYIINKDDIISPSDREISKTQKELLEAAVDKTIDDYSETLRLLKET